MQEGCTGRKLGKGEITESLTENFFPESQDLRHRVKSLEVVMERVQKNVGCWHYSQTLNFMKGLSIEGVMKKRLSKH